MWNFNKILFLCSMMAGTLVAVSANSWFSMWMGLEINLLSFIPIMRESGSLYSSEATMKYFITQTVASSILLFSILMISFNKTEIQFISTHLILMLNSSLLTKMGAAPFHFWFPEVMEGLNWFSCMLLLTWQKLAPLVLLIYSNKNIYFLLIAIVSCMIISGVMGQNQLSLRKVMAYSSINHMGWMISGLLFIESIWFIYFIIYSVITVNIILMFKEFNVFFIPQLISVMNSSLSMKTSFIMNFLSLGGLPPFLGFFPKWLTIQMLVDYNLMFWGSLMIILTLFTLFFYIRVTFGALLMSANSTLIYSNKKTKSFFMMFFNLMSLMSLIMCTITFNMI